MVNSSHFVKGINTTIVNANLVNYQLGYHGRTTDHLQIIKSSFSSQDNGITSLGIFGTQASFSDNVPSSRVEGISGGQTSFWDVHISGANQTTPVIQVTTGCELRLTKCTFLKNSVWHSNWTVISLHETKAVITDCNFTENRNPKGNGGAIRATKNSLVNISRCRFSKNYAYLSAGAIYAVAHVNVSIVDSKFIENKAFHHGGVIATSHNTTFNISNSDFTKNSATLSNGGCLTMAHGTNFAIKDTQFKGNVAGKEGGVIHADTDNKIIIEDTKFTNNRAKVRTGVLSVSYWCFVNLTRSRFINNTADLTMSVISANHYVHMFLDNCLFDNNPSAFTGLLEASDVCIIGVSNSTFTRNSADVGSLIEIGGMSAFVVHDSLFAENTRGSLIYGHNLTTLLFQKCHFLNHYLPADPIMVISDAYVEMNNSTFINNTQHKEGGIVIGKSKCTVNVTSCLFRGNQASKGAAFYISRESRLVVDNSTFMNNTAGDGAVLYILDSNASFTDTNISYAIGTGYGGVMKALNSKITVSNSNFSFNDAFFGGCFYLVTNSSLAAYDSIFEHSTARQGGAIYKSGPGNVSLENCTLGFNRGKFGGAIYAINVNYLRLAQGLCQYKPYLKRDCLTLHCWNSEYACELYTYNYTISNGNFTLNSHKDHHFFESAKQHGMIFRQKTGRAWLETPFASRKNLFLVF